MSWFLTLISKAVKRANRLTNIEKLQAKIGDFCDCAIITSDVNRRYFTDMKSSAGTVVVFPDKAYLIIDFRYIEKAKSKVKACEVIEQQRLFHQINGLLKKHGAKRIAIESDYLTVSGLIDFKANLKGKIIADKELSRLITSLRTVKSDEEIQKIEKAQRIAEKAFSELLNFIKAGKNEREIALKLDSLMLENGAEALSFETIVLSGKNTSMPHGVPSDKKVEQGDFVLMDFGAVYDGYHSDMTRTVCVGEPTDKQQKIYDIVLDAQKQCIDFAKAGISGSQLDKIARDIISNEGYGECFGHSLGHGVGLEIHEFPNASPNSDYGLLKNSVVTIEPGIYIEGEFGVRIEDFVVLKENGCENLTKAPKELIVL